MAILLDRLTTPHRPTELLAALNPLWGARSADGSMRAVIESVSPTGIDAAAVRIRTPRSFPRHTPGQFVVLGVDVDGVRRHRSFTITSLPDERHIEVTVQASAAGTVSTHLVRRARRGELLTVSAPAGGFTLEEATGPLLFVSGGSGVTPFIAMLRSLAVAEMRDHPAGHERPDVVMLHHVTQRSAVLHGAELAALGASMPWLRLELVETRAEDGARHDRVHLDPSRLEDLCSDWRSRTAFVCGPQGLLEFARAHWGRHLPADRLRTESFGGPDLGGPIQLCETDSFDASFTASGVTSRAGSQDTLLVVAESAGLSPAYGCRMGICHTCSTPVRSGRARDLRDGELVESGSHVQLCISAAATDIEIDL